jgi:uncharacterized membrane protein/ketosteroid isomerase-like protein
MEPNWHPVIVHFVVAFFLTLPLLFLFAALQKQGSPRRLALQAAGDWMLALGVLAAAAAVAAGLYAYATVRHDGPSHLAMTDHRNFALGAFGLVAAIAVWRLMRRSAAPSMLFVVAIFAASAAVATTAYKGGRLVYHFGLGVASMPAADEGEGHHHHGAATDDHHDDDSGDADEAEAHDHHPAAAGEIQLAESGLAAAAVDAFAAALRAGDEAKAKSLLANDVIIAEEGGAERSGEEYASHHMGADMLYMQGVETTQIKRDEVLSPDLAVIVTENMVHGSFLTKPIHSRVMETMVLKRDSGAWRIHHIHWSSAPIEGEHEH